jgi:hypothetical protein
MALIPFETKLARFRAVERHPSGKIVSDYDRRRKAAGVKKHATKAGRVKRRLVKRRANAELRAVLKMARAVMGWKPTGMSGRKLSPSHVAAFHAGRDRYHQATRDGLKNGQPGAVS